MAGLYLHIPFCRRACHYCNFHFSTTARYQDRMIQAMIAEMDIQQSYLKEKQFETVYLGGGTPSLLSAAQLNQLFEAIHRHFSLDTHPEITLEANPDDITVTGLIEWKKMGINRLSIGVQSFQAEELSWMNRVHHADQSMVSIVWALEAGFTDLNIDLIYGIPGSTMSSWESNLNQFFKYRLPHLSAYALTVEPKTALHAMIQRRKIKPPEEDLANNQFMVLQSRMQEAGYQNYELSNYALPGALARHNTAYWQGAPYLGIGPSAHSYDLISRQWNIAHNIQYMQAIEQGVVPCEREEINPEKKYNEWVMTALRTQWGCKQNDLDQFEKKYRDYFLARISSWLADNLITTDGMTYTLTLAGKLWADRIASDLFYLEE